MIDILDRLYTSIVDRHKLLASIGYYSILRFLIRVFANLTMPIYYLLTKDNANYTLNSDPKTGEKILVSLTSFPSRIGRLWLVIESLLRQTKKPDRIILWLSSEQFQTLDHLPKKIINQTNRGLEIRLVEGDIRSHKKYYYVLKENPNDFIITVDDDIFYRTTMLEDLIAYNKRFPCAVISQYCKEIRWLNNELMPYNSWELLKEEKRPGFDLFFGTGGGTLFPPGSINSLALEKDLFIKLTPTADDVWLNAMCQLNRTPIANTKYYSSMLPVINRDKFSLHNINNGLSQNDLQIKSLISFFRENGISNPFERNRI